MNISKRDKQCFHYTCTHHQHFGSKQLCIEVIGHRIYGDTRLRHKPRVDDFWSITYFHDQVTINVDNNIIDVPAQHIVITPAQLALTVQPTRNEFLHSWIRLKGTLFEKTVAPWPTLLAIPVNNDELIRDTWSQIHRDLITHKEQSAEVLCLTLELLFAKIKRSIDDHEEISIPQHIHNAKLFIMQHLHQNISLEDIAAIAGCSARHLTREFRHYLGMTPIAFFNNLRMDAAKKLLAETNDSIANIAHTFGFSDSFSFSKSFKKNTGDSPSSWRTNKK